MQKYQENFGKLSVKQAAIVSGALSRVEDSYKAPKKITGLAVFAACRTAELDQATVVTALAGESSPDAIAAMETITGKKIKAAKPQKATDDGQPKTPKAVKAKAKNLSDPRIITAFIANPKRPGSAAHARYNLYVDGMSVDQAIAAGIKRADIAWDKARDFITLAQPDSADGKKSAAAFAKSQ